MFLVGVLWSFGVPFELVLPQPRAANVSPPQVFPLLPQPSAANVYPPQVLPLLLQPSAAFVLPQLPLGADNLTTVPVLDTPPCQRSVGG